MTNLVFCLFIAMVTLRSVQLFSIKLGCAALFRTFLNSYFLMFVL